MAIMWIKRFKKLFFVLAVLMALVIVALIYCDSRVSSSANGRLYDDISLLPARKTGLLLGTSKSFSSGRINTYYANRIDAAALLMREEKIKYLIISGDNSRKEYNEPRMMKDDLIQLGIDSNRIYLDYAGFRTLDSVVRCREIFSQDNVTVISQAFHNERALFIASNENVDAIGFNAKEVTGVNSTRVRVREKLARVKVFLDMIFGVDPKFLGEKILIE